MNKEKTTTMIRFSETDRIGVNKIEGIFLKNFKWIPRSVFQSDVGIDMTVEVAIEGRPTGQLIAIQIKTGKSYFNEESDNNIVYRGKQVHLDYWLNHVLPTIIVLHHPIEDLTIWEVIDHKNVKNTGNGWKILIPLSKKLNPSKRSELFDLSGRKLPQLLQHYNRLISDLSLMELLKKRKKLVIEIDSMVSKNGGRAETRIILVDNGEDQLIKEFFYYNFSIDSSLKVLFPWAEICSIDDDAYVKLEYDYFLLENSPWDSEAKTLFELPEEDFEDYRNTLPKIRPIPGALEAEIQTYRLIFTLNKLGNSFLKTNKLIQTIL